MKHVNEWIFVVSMVLCCSIARAQGTYVLTNETTSAEVIFTNSLGTATNEGTMIVFEGQLESNFEVDYARPTGTFYGGSCKTPTPQRLTACGRDVLSANHPTARRGRA